MAAFRIDGAGPELPDLSSLSRGCKRLKVRHRQLRRLGRIRTRYCNEGWYAADACVYPNLPRVLTTA